MNKKKLIIVSLIVVVVLGLVFLPNLLGRSKNDRGESINTDTSDSANEPVWENEYTDDEIKGFSDSDEVTDDTEEYDVETSEPISTPEIDDRFIEGGEGEAGVPEPRTNIDGVESSDPEDSGVSDFDTPVTHDEQVANDR